MRPIDIRKLTKREAVDTDYRLTIDKDNNQCLTKQPDKSLTEDELKALPVRDALVTDKRLTLDSTNNFVMTNQPDNSAIGTAASKDTGTAADQIPLNSDLGTSATKDIGTLSTQVPTNGDLGTASVVDVGTAQDQIETNALKDFKSFDSLTSAIAYVTANPDNIKRLDTASYRSSAECTALGIAYPDGGGADYVVGAGLGVADGVNIVSAGSLQLKLNAGAYQLSVPSDASTLKAALDSLAVADKAVTTVIRLEAGYQIEEGYAFINKDLGNVTITSDDAIVKTSAAVTWINSAEYPESTSLVAGSTDILFLGIGSKLPTLDILVDLEGKVASQGINVGGGSNVIINRSKGFINAGGAAALCFGSTLTAIGSLFTNAGDNGLWISAAAQINVKEAVCDGAGNYGLLATRGSIVEFSDGSAKNCAVRGMRSSSGATLHAQRSFVDGSAIGMQARTGGFIDFSAGSAINCTGVCIDAHNMGSVSADTSTLSSTTDYAISCFGGGEVSFASATATSGRVDGYSLTVSNGGYIYATNATYTTARTVNEYNRDGCVLDAAQPSHSTEAVVTVNANGTARAYSDGMLVMTHTISPDWNSTADQSFPYPAAYVGASNPAVYLSSPVSASANFRTQYKDTILFGDETSWVLAFGTAGLTTGFPIQVTAITKWK